MELFYLYLLLSIILFVISIFTGVEFLISGDDYAERAQGTQRTSGLCCIPLNIKRIQNRLQRKSGELRRILRLCSSEQNRTAI